MTNNQTDSEKIIEVSEPLKPHVKYILVGDNEQLNEQLIAKSKQPHILTGTPSDAAERFGDSQMLSKWLKKNRIIHWLVGENEDLAGIIWYGKSQPPIDLGVFPVPQYTFAIRIYEGYFGKGLAKPFMKQSLKILEESLRNNDEELTGLWLKTRIDNEPAVAVYSKFGYREVARDEKMVYMTLNQSDLNELIS